jgi:hypothetical protein
MGLLSGLIGGSNSGSGGNFDGGFNSTDQNLTETTNRTHVDNSNIVAEAGGIVVRGRNNRVLDGGVIAQAFDFEKNALTGALTTNQGALDRVALLHSTTASDLRSFAEQQSATTDQKISDLVKWGLIALVVTAGLPAALRAYKGAK